MEGKHACMDKHCLGCKYYRCIYEEMWYCAYLIETDKRRPCPPGKGCTVKAKKEKGEAK